MGKKFYIINNGLKDLHGHYYETAISVAEAARDLGWAPLLAAHNSCPKDLVPDWLPFFPVFHTDHWMPGRMQRCKRIIRDGLPESWHEVSRRAVQLAKKFLAEFRQRLLGQRKEANGHIPRFRQLETDLQEIGSGEEFTNLNVFLRDLQTLLDTTHCQPDDHLFLPTAHGRELVAIQQLIAENAKAPHFHLEFRHDLAVYSSTYREQHRVFFHHARGCQRQDQIRLYSDTPELATSLEEFSGLRFATLPIPFRNRMIKPISSSRTIRLSYFGDMRDEKGFYWLPELVAALKEDYLLPGRISFVIQISRNPASYSRRSRRALKSLKKYDAHQVLLVGQDGPLPPEEYYRLISETNVLLCPYQAQRYRQRSSGIFSEGIAAGIPTVCPANTWMSSQQPCGSGETFVDLQSFIEAVKLICDKYADYQTKAMSYSPKWMAFHSPVTLVEAVLGKNK